MGKRIIFTGGSGKAGRHRHSYLLEQGHTVLNLDLKPFRINRADADHRSLTNSGEVFNALSSISASRAGDGRGRAEGGCGGAFRCGASHFIQPDNTTFSANAFPPTMSLRRP